MTEIGSRTQARSGASGRRPARGSDASAASREALRRDTGDTADPGPTDVSPTGDLQTLLSAALERIARELSCERACAWVPQGDAPPLVLAAAYREGSPSAATSEDAAALEVAWKQDNAFDLAQDNAFELAEKRS